MQAPMSVEDRLRRLADLAVPGVADWCAVHLVRNDRVDQVAVAHSDPEKVAFVARLQERYPPDPDADGGAIQVSRRAARCSSPRSRTSSSSTRRRGRGAPAPSSGRSGCTRRGRAAAGPRPQPGRADTGACRVRAAVRRGRRRLRRAVGRRRGDRAGQRAALAGAGGRSRTRCRPRCCPAALPRRPRRAPGGPLPPTSRPRTRGSRWGATSTTSSRVMRPGAGVRSWPTSAARGRGRGADGADPAHDAGGDRPRPRAGRRPAPAQPRDAARGGVAPGRFATVVHAEVTVNAEGASVTAGERGSPAAAAAPRRPGGAVTAPGTWWASTPTSS